MSDKIYIVQGMVGNASGYAKDIKTKDIRLQGKNVEKVLVDYFEAIRELQDKTENISIDDMIFTVIDDIKNDMNDMNVKMGQIKIQSDKISLIVKSVDGTGSVQLTDKMLSAIAENITFTAKNIDLNGYVSNRKIIDEEGNEVIVEGNWHIDEDGNAEYNSLSINEEISTKNLSVETISSPQYPKSLTGSMKVYVNSISGNDEQDLSDECTFKTIDALIDNLPKDLNGSVVDIYLMNDFVENIALSYFSNGMIRIYLCSHKLYGWIDAFLCMCSVKIYGGSSTSTTEVSSYGKIVPPTLYQYDSETYDSISIRRSTQVSLHHLDMYGLKSIANSNILHVTDFSNVLLSNCRFFDGVNGVYCNIVSKLYGLNTSGKVNGIGWYAATGSDIRLGGGNQMGGTTNTKADNSSQVFYVSSPIFDGNTSSETNPGKPPTPSPTTKTVTYTSTYADTYRNGSGYNNWKKDGTARQGNYGYGSCDGAWFFGNQFTNLKGKNIKSIKITITRQTGGYGSNSVPIKIKMHNHSGRPGGKPSYISGWDKNLSLTANKSGSLTITDSAVLNAIQNGSMKGFGIQSTYNKANYVVCSGTCKVTVTYQV